MLQKKLEEIKKMGNYGVVVYYGGEVGEDDSMVPADERQIKVLMSPVGCLGEVRIFFVGTVKEFLTANLKKKPTQVPNPPKRTDVEGGGYFIWGTENSVQSILKNPFFGQWE